MLGFRNAAGSQTWDSKPQSTQAGFRRPFIKEPSQISIGAKSPIFLHKARKSCARYLLAPLGPCLTVPWLTNSCCPYFPWLPWSANPGPWPSAHWLLLSHWFNLSHAGPRGSWDMPCCMDRAFLVQPSLAELAERGIRHAVTGPPLGTSESACGVASNCMTLPGTVRDLRDQTPQGRGCS